MENKGCPTESAEECLTDEKWQAIVRSDAAYDGKFFYAVRTTRIFCRPSCKSKVPNKENVRIFQSAEQALTANFRPCKRCRPNARRLPNQEWVAQIKQYIDSNYSEALTLDHLAQMCHGSPSHLHRTFKRFKGMTPIEYIQQTRMAKAEECLIHTNKTIADIGLSVGIGNTSYFITAFKKKTGYTPAQYRQFIIQTEALHK